MTSALYRQLAPSAPPANDLFDFTSQAAAVFPPDHPTRDLLATSWIDAPLVFSHYDAHYGALEVCANGLAARLSVTDADAARAMCTTPARESIRVTAFESGSGLVLLVLGESCRWILNVHAAALAA